MVELIVCRHILSMKSEDRIPVGAMEKRQWRLSGFCNTHCRAMRAFMRQGGNTRPMRRTAAF